MIPYFNRTTRKIDVLCSKYEQFDGHGSRRPHDLEVKKELLFRWLNPVCVSDTFLPDSADAPAKVLRWRRGAQRLVRRRPQSDTSSTESSEPKEEDAVSCSS